MHGQILPNVYIKLINIIHIENLWDFIKNIQFWLDFLKAILYT